MLEQFAREALRLYPQASILDTQREDLQAGRRHQFIAIVASRTTTIYRPVAAPFQGHVSGAGHGETWNIRFSFPLTTLTGGSAG